MTWDDEHYGGVTPEGHAAQENQIDDDMVKGGAEWLVSQFKSLPDTEPLWVVVQRTYRDGDTTNGPTNWAAWGPMTTAQKTSFLRVIGTWANPNHFYSYKMHSPTGIEGV